MPRKTKKEPKVSQKQKSTQAQAVKQTVKVVVGEMKKPKRRYRRREKPSQPIPQAQTTITPIPQVIQLPQQQTPFPMFSPDQFSRAIADQINQRLMTQPALAEATPVPPEGQIAMVEPDYRAPSIASSMMPAKREMEQTDESLQQELDMIRQQQEDEMAKAQARMPPRSEIPQATTRRKVSYISRADLAEMYFGLTGEYPPTSMKRDDLAKEVNKMRRSAGTKMQP